VATLRTWWQTIGRQRYPDASRLLICADGGGSNGYRIRARKIELVQLAAGTGLQITVCHLPPGTSKWNKIEHRLFSQITLNWRGRPLRSHEVIVDLISSTTTATGLTVHCVLDTGDYPTGIRYPRRTSRCCRSPTTISMAPGTTRSGHPTRRNDQRLFRREPQCRHHERQESPPDVPAAEPGTARSPDGGGGSVPSLCVRWRLVAEYLEN
jgi:hypothetical protein